ncbi:hypothetical protein BHM03_00028268 [Ensete ventricosum]|nr:hypothetical protein BHM03_00028268 [Ensete ventricosum]
MYREFCERTADENAIRPMKIGRRMWKDEIACVGVSVGSTDPKRKICAPIQCHALPWVLLHASAIYRVFQLCKVGGVLQARFTWVSLLLRDSGTLPHPGPAIMYGDLHHCLVLFNSPYRERRRRSKGQYATPRALACSCIDVCFRTFGRTPHLLGSLLHGLDNSKKSL